MISIVNQQLKLNLESIEAETISGLLTEKTGQVPNVGDRIEFVGAVAEVLEIRGSRASSIQMDLQKSSSGKN